MNKTIKNIITFSTSLMLFVGILFMVGCNNTNNNIGTNPSVKNNTSSEPMQSQKKILCANFPQYDWIKNIIGEKNTSFTLELLMENGGDLHNYQPTAADIIKISESDLFVVVGGESDAWVQDATKNSVNKEQQVVKLMEHLLGSLKEEEVVEGMQPEATDNQETSDTEYDEHVWLSLLNAQNMVNYLTDIICEADPENEDTYKKNSLEYIAKLHELDNKYIDVIGKADKKVILFGDRFPFRYLTDDYNLDYYAAFSGCSAETEASFETIAFLAKKVNENQLNSVIALEKSDQKVAKSIISNTATKDQTILTMNSLQSITKEEMDNGKTYLNTMEDNLEVLKEALK